MTNKEHLRDLAGGVFDEVSYLKDFINTSLEDDVSSEDVKEDYKSINDQCMTIMTLLDVIVDIVSEKGH